MLPHIFFMFLSYDITFTLQSQTIHDRPFGQRELINGAKLDVRVIG